MTSSDIGKTPDDFGMSTLSLEDFRGEQNVVLLFFPAAYAPPCTQEMCSATAKLSDFASLNAAVIGVSVDNPFAQKAWAEEEGIKVPILSDYRREVIEAYGVVLPDLIGLGPGAQRAAFVIDKQGIVRYAEITETPLDMPDMAAIRTCLESLN